MLAVIRALLKLPPALRKKAIAEQQAKRIAIHAALRVDNKGAGSKS